MPTLQPTIEQTLACLQKRKNYNDLMSSTAQNLTTMITVVETLLADPFFDVYYPAGYRPYLNEVKDLIVQTSGSFPVDPTT